jgi:twitching motility protein PilT
MNEHTSSPKDLRVATDPPDTVADDFQKVKPRRGSPEIDAFLRAVIKSGASDLHVKSGQPPRLRIDGELRKVDREPVPSELFEARVFSLLDEKERRRLLVEGSVDLAYELGDIRFRINVYRQESGISAAARVVPRQIPSFADLHLPPIVAKVAGIEQGLILVSGVTGSGKSTTIAAMLEHINNIRHKHIVTIEDPIEFLYTSKKCLIDQRELGINVPDYALALRALLREDPDIILIGEMRDADTFRAALRAADTGHLVFGTVHAANTSQTIGRVVGLFDEAEKPSIRESLVFSLRAIISQKLLRSSAEGVHRVPAVEVLISTPIVRELIERSRDIELADVVRTGDEGMTSFTESLYSLFHDKLIDEETGCQAAPNRQEFEMRLAGIKPSTRAIVG